MKNFTSIQNGNLRTELNVDDIYMIQEYLKQLKLFIFMEHDFMDAKELRKLKKEYRNLTECVNNL